MRIQDNFTSYYQKINSPFFNLNEGMIKLEPELYQPILDYFIESAKKFKEESFQKARNATFPDKKIELNFDNSRWEFLKPYSRPITVRLSASDKSYHNSKGLVQLNVKDSIREIIYVVEHEVIHEIQFLLGKYKNRNSNKKEYSGLSKKQYQNPVYDVDGYKISFIPYYYNKRVFLLKKSKGREFGVLLKIPAQNKKQAFNIFKRMLQDKIVVTLENNKKKTFTFSERVQTDLYDKNKYKPARALTDNDMVQGVPIKKIEKKPVNVELGTSQWLGEKISKDNIDFINFKDPQILKTLKSKLRFEEITSNTRTTHALRPIEFQTNLNSALRYLQYLYLKEKGALHSDDIALEFMKDKDSKKEYFNRFLKNEVKSYVIKPHEKVRKPYIKELYRNFVEIDELPQFVGNIREIKNVQKIEKPIPQKKEIIIKDKKYDESFFKNSTVKEPSYDIAWTIMDELDDGNIDWVIDFFYFLKIPERYSSRDDEDFYYIKRDFSNYIRMGKKIKKLYDNTGDDYDSFLYAVGGFNLFRFLLKYKDIQDVKNIYEYLTGINIDEELKKHPDSNLEKELNGTIKESFLSYYMKSV